MEGFERFLYWIFTFLAVIAGSFWLFYLWSMRKFRFWKDRGIAYIEPSFPFGNTKGIFKKIRFSVLLTNLYNKFKGKEKFVGLYLFMRPIGTTTDPDLVKQILVKDFNNFHDRGLYHNIKDDPLSGHLFTLEGEPWRVLRAKMSPTFTSGKIKMMFHIMVEVTKELQKIVDEQIKSTNEFNISDIMARFTMDIIGNCAFGIECNALKNPDEELMVFGKKFFIPSRKQMMRQTFFSLFPDLARKLGVPAIDETVSSFFMRVITETVKYREQNKVVRPDFMDLLLKLKNSGTIEVDGKEEKTGLITLNELAAQCLVFFLAGFETSSTTISFCLYELAHNPDIQEKLRKEIMQSLEETNGMPTYEAVMGMKYLEKVINETLRKYPAVEMLARKAKNDYPIEGTSVTIPGNTLIFIPIYTVHHDSNIYPEPDKFDPERFSEENVRSRHPYTYLPFGEGPRNCIGMRFGLLQTRIGIITMLSNYRLTVCDKTPKAPLEFMPTSIVLKVQSGIWLRMDKL
ncbi:cytochrome P450 6a2-like [Phlebotomus argentipes]|uniref:cytochrome P450 6a2-like n=1 Tax=Phlebotomus argentipes TaxID=94469 RepID=UPI0028931589|nr:cytochrome P450 6a2-like [Phlebotomus argentipes]